MEGSVKSNIEFPKYPHSAIICGQTNCGKSVIVLDLLKNEYKGVFENIVILGPTIAWNKAYKNKNWRGDVRRPKEKNIIIVNPVMRDGIEILQELLRYFLINSQADLHCTPSMTALRQKNSQRKKPCSRRWHFLVGTQSKVSGSFRKDIFLS